jgi:hypothetical protein
MKNHENKQMEDGDPDTGKYPHRNCNNTRYDIMHGTRTDHILKGGSAMNHENTRGVRNCNPLNIRIGNNWKGERPTNSDGVFEQFTDMHYGLRAAFILLRRYITKYRLCTIRAIVRRWAPETENLTLAYINHVERLSGIDAGEPISATDKESLFRIVTAMCWVESLYKPSREELEEGWKS